MDAPDTRKLALLLAHYYHTARSVLYSSYEALGALAVRIVVLILCTFVCSACASVVVG